VSIAEECRIRVEKEERERLFRTKGASSGTAPLAGDSTQLTRRLRRTIKRIIDWKLQNVEKEWL
jgi:hypothetical protein